LGYSYLLRSEIEQAEYQQHQFQSQYVGSRQTFILPTPEKIKSLSTDLSQLLEIIGEHVEEFAALLKNPRNRVSVSDSASLLSISPLCHTVIAVIVMIIDVVQS
jgi:hypothetical protein